MDLDSITIKNLRNFIKVIEHDGVQNAAKDTGITKSTIYSHVQWLEAKTGCKFFYGVINRRNLTPEGRDMYKYATDILNILDNDIRCLSLKNKKAK